MCINKEFKHTIINYTRPLCFDNWCKDHPYCMKGSGVMLSLNGEKFALTAKHLLSGYQPEQAMFSYLIGDGNQLPIRSIFEVENNNVDDTDHKDILVYSVWKERLESAVNEESFFNLGCNDSQSRLDTTRYWAVGYPANCNSVDFEEEALKGQPVAFPLNLAHENRFLHVDEYNVISSDDFETLQGMSGGSVFSATTISQNRAKIRFEGLIIKGSKESRLMYVINENFIYSLLIKVLEKMGLPQPSPQHMPDRDFTVREIQIAESLVEPRESDV